MIATQPSDRMIMQVMATDGWGTALQWDFAVIFALDFNTDLNKPHGLENEPGNMKRLPGGERR